MNFVCAFNTCHSYLANLLTLLLQLRSVNIS